MENRLAVWQVALGMCLDVRVHLFAPVLVPLSLAEACLCSILIPCSLLLGYRLPDVC